MKTLALLMMMSVGMMAADYGAMSLEELRALRGSVPSEDRSAFQEAMQTKMQALTPEERSALQTKHNQTGPRDGTGMQLRKGSSTSTTSTTGTRYQRGRMR